MMVAPLDRPNKRADPMSTSSFVPENFDPSDFANIEPLGKKLLEQPATTAAEAATWIENASELFAVIWEYGTRKHIDNACFTEDEEKEKAFLHFIQEVQPKIEPMMFELKKKVLADGGIDQLKAPGTAVMKREWTSDVELFRKENVQLEVQDEELSTEYGKISGAMTVEFDGETKTLQQMAPYLEETDRSVREQAWRLVAERRQQDRDKIEEIFEKQLTIRSQIATNADHPDYRSYMWQVRKRFDYTPDDVLAFGDAVEAVVTPLAKTIDEQRHADLGVDALRPWDGSVDPKGRPPLKPFDPADIDSFVEKTRQCFDRYSPEFATMFATLSEHGDLDLDSRLGKRPGGFQASLEASRRPFIFMNSAGVHGDVVTMLHEGGHAFHYLDSRDIENVFVRHAPLEFCEVASMTQELLGADHYDAYYDDPEHAARAKRNQLERSATLLGWVATIVCFQHWLYTHEGHDRAARQAAWLETYGRFSSGVTDWSGLESYRESMWQRQIHLFSYPFYYIEYGIAQLGALQVWLNYRNDPQLAMSNLRKAFRLGGTKPLPEVFAAAGAEFDFGQSTLRRLVDAVGEELEKLPQ
jgi:oligoendopeptidase F